MKLVAAVGVAVLGDPTGFVSFLLRISMLILKSCWIFAITAFCRSIVVVRVLMVEESSWYWESTFVVNESTDLVFSNK